jgi:hypothetical protein
MLNLNGPEIARFLRATRWFPSTVLAGFIEANPVANPLSRTSLPARGSCQEFIEKLPSATRRLNGSQPGNRGLSFSMAL